MILLRDFYRSSMQTFAAFRRDIGFQRKRRALGRAAAWDELRASRPVFVLSTGRVGTKLLTQLLDQSPLLWAEHAPMPELAHQSSLIYRDRPSLDAIQWAFLHARMDAMSRVQGAGLRYVETNNRISLYAPAIAQLLPDARFLHLVRHPAEFVRSGMRRGYYANMPPEQSGHFEPRREDPVYGAWPSMDRVEKIAWQWNEINASIEEFKDSVAASRVFFMRSDDLFQGVSYLEDLFAFVGVSCPEHRKLAAIQRRQPNRQQRGDFPQWQDWDEALRAKLRRWATLAGRYGFEV